MVELALEWLIVILGLPSALTGLCFFLVERRIIRQQAKKDEEDRKRRAEEDNREQLREKQQLLLVQCVSASIALGEATARAVQRIPDAHCNGDMHRALEYAQKVKNEQKGFLEAQGVHFLYE